MLRERQAVFLPSSVKGARLVAFDWLAGPASHAADEIPLQIPYDLPPVPYHLAQPIVAPHRPEYYQTPDAQEDRPWVWGLNNFANAPQNPTAHRVPDRYGSTE